MAGTSQVAGTSEVAGTSGGGATCAETLVCYGACEPMTEACVTQCENAAAAGVPAQSRAVVTCMASTGCETLECLQSRCPAEYGACLATLAPAQVATGANASPISDGFQYTSATFDDGWVATAERDWVLAEKRGVRLYLYYGLAYDGSPFSGTGLTARDHYWDTVVARDFAVTSKAYRDGYSIGMKPECVEGWANDRATGQRRFLMMRVTLSPGAAHVIVLSSPDEQTLHAWFPNAAEPFRSELPELSRYNRFPIGANDLAGTWADSDTTTMNWYDANTGAYAGATAAARSATFRFAADGSYTSTHNGATGRIGAMNAFQQEYAGTYTVAPWSVVATNRWQGGTETFAAHFQIVRGGRLLAFESNQGASYLLVRTAR